MKAKVRSILLVSVISLVLNYDSTGVAQQPQNPNTVVLATKNMCCAVESVPAIKELSKVPGVARVVADHNTRSLTIIPKPNALPSPLAIWEAAERAKLEPTRLSTAQGVYNAKPKLRR
jgi:periplasmic mercuric ion binding protein